MKDIKELDPFDLYYLKFRFKMVYQSGHVDTWCNDKIHINIGGDANGTAPINKDSKVCMFNIFNCDCKKYKKSE